MNIEAHLACGWVLAHLGGPETRRFRGLVTLAAIAPDVDAISYFWGIDAYANWHHAIGHNIYFGLLFSIFSVFFIHQRRLKIFCFTQLAFATHYFGDYFFTRFPIRAFWPLYNHAYIHGYRIGLDHPVNLWFSYLSFLIIAVMGIIFKRTPVEFLSRALDQRLVNLLPARPLHCHICNRGANEICHRCQRPVCLRHGQITRSFLVRCKACESTP